MRFRIAALAIALAACGGTPATKPPPPMPVRTVTLASQAIASTSEYLAQMRSRTAPALRPQVDGQVTAILVKPGDVVAAGTPLLRIDPGRQPSAVAQARAQQGSRKAELQLAERNLARVRELVGEGALPQQELDNAQEVYDAAKSAVAALGAEIRGSQVQLRYYEVRAPTRGIVGDIPVRVGDRVTPTTTVTSVTDNSVLEANVSIPVQRVKDVELGTEIRVADNQGATLGTGHVRFISPEVNVDTQSLLVKADIDNSSGKLRADQIVRAWVVWGTRPGLAVPALAVTWQGGQPFVYVVEQSPVGAFVRQRPVQLGELADNVYPVKAGLQPGMAIVAADLQKLRDGAQVTVRG